MKTIIACIVLLCFSAPVFSQQKLEKILPLKDGVVTYDSMISVNGASKKQLYTRAKNWMTETYTRKNILKTNQSLNKLVSTGSFKAVYKKQNPDIFYIITVTVKQEKYMYNLTQFAYFDKKNNKYAIEQIPANWNNKKKFYTKIDEQANAVIGSLQKAMDPSAK